MSARILALFDSEEATQNIKKRLQPQNEVVFVQTSNQALQRIQNQQFDLILCAAHLTDESFFDFLKSLRHAEDKNDRNIPFICCSSTDSDLARSVEEPIKHACRLLGGDHYMSHEEFYSEQLVQDTDRLLGPIATHGKQSGLP